MEEKWLNKKEYDELFKGILTLKDIKECRNFFRDLCTVSELEDMAERFQVAKKILNEESYRDINKQTGSSTTTITRVAHWLHHGMGGYGLVIRRLKS